MFVFAIKLCLLLFMLFIIVWLQKCSLFIYLSFSFNFSYFFSLVFFISVLSPLL